MVIDPARAMHHYPTMEANLLVCSNYIDASYMIAFAYPIFLVAVCTVYAVLTRKIPEAFNESKHIGESWPFRLSRSYYALFINVSRYILNNSINISKKKKKRINERERRNRYQ